MKQFFLLTIYFTLSTFVFSQSNFDIAIEKAKNILLTKETFETIAKDGYHGKFYDHGANSSSNFYETYKIPINDSIKNIAYFSFDYDLNNTITGLSFILREPIKYEEASSLLNYKYWGEPEIFRFKNSGRVIRFEFYHEISEFMNRYHYYMVLERLPNRDTGGYSDGVVMWGWTKNKELFLKANLSLEK